MPQSASTKLPKSFIPETTTPKSFVPDSETGGAQIPPPPSVPVPDMKPMNTFGYPAWDETVNQVSKVFSSIPELIKSGVILTEQPTATIARQIKDPNAATPSDVVKNLAGGLVEPAKRYLIEDTDSGLFERLWNTVEAYAGADPESVKKYNTEGDPGRAFAAEYSVPLLTLGLGRMLKAVPGLQDAKVPLAPYRKEIESLASLLTKGVREGEPQVVAQTVQPLYKQAAQELGIDAKTAFPARETAPKTDVVGNLRRGAGNAIAIADKAVEVSERPLNAAMQVYGDMKVPRIQTQVADQLETIAKTFDNKDAPLASAIRGVAEDVRVRGGTVKGLNELKAHANKEMNRLFGASTGQQIAASAQSSYAYRLMADEIRANLYPAIQEMGGPNLSTYGAREAAAIQARDGIYGHYFGEAAPGQAGQLGQTYLEYVTSGSLYHHHLQAKAIGLYKTPIGRFNQMFRRGLGPVADDMVGESVTTTPTTYGARTQKLLAPPPGSAPGFAFKIEGEPLIQQMQQLNLVDAEARPLPATKTGLNYGAGRASDEMQNWQYLGEHATGPLRKAAGPGTLMTNDPAVVANTVRAIDRQLALKPPPALKARLQQLQTNLIQQLEAYQSHVQGVRVTPGTVTVNPANMGTRTTSTAKARYGAPIVIHAETERNRNK